MRVRLLDWNDRELASNDRIRSMQSRRCKVERQRVRHQPPLLPADCSVKRLVLMKFMKNGV